MLLVSTLLVIIWFMKTLKKSRKRERERQREREREEKREREREKEREIEKTPKNLLERRCCISQLAWVSYPEIIHSYPASVLN